MENFFEFYYHLRQILKNKKSTQIYWKDWKNKYLFKISIKNTSGASMDVILVFLMFTWNRCLPTQETPKNAFLLSFAVNFKLLNRIWWLYICTLALAFCGPFYHIADVLKNLLFFKLCKKILNPAKKLASLAYHLLFILFL